MKKIILMLLLGMILQACSKNNNFDMARDLKCSYQTTRIYDENGSFKGYARQRACHFVD